jgi:hypothetical protein
VVREKQPLITHTEERKLSRRTEELTATLSPVERRAFARNERHRVHAELHAVEGWLAEMEPEDIVEPGDAYKPIHHHDAEKAKADLAKSRKRRRHWKVKEWKRRTALRRSRVLAEKELAKAS